MIINLQVYELDNAFMGESLELCINSNIPEIASTPIEFWGSNRAEVIEQVKAYARHKFGAGSIRIAK
jgi:hypothetical protein